jgi:hypothetical protein
MRHMRGALLVVGLLLLAACQGAQEVVEVREDRVIFTAEEAEQMQLKPWIEGTPPLEGFWTPEPSQVQALEATLPAFLAERQAFFRREPPPWQSLAAYKAQYLGVTDRGQRLIYGNFFCDAVEWDDWQQQMVLVDDGGDCFFQVRYNPASGKFISLEVNGEA